MKESVVLIGMPSCGKSTLGVLLAKRLGMAFTDADLLIQAREGKLLHQLIEERGAEGFLQIENEVNLALDCRRTVVATGGSVVYCKEAMERFRREACVVYLRIPFEVMRERLGDYSHRGVVCRSSGGLEALYAEREPLYARYAHWTVDVCNESLSRSVERICRALEQ
ncbi:MAG: shikimate kinase [Clostridia bacterium]|nr:shikimate kinase [Clostridia bacterium]